MPEDKKPKKGATQGFDGVKGDQTARRINDALFDGVRKHLRKMNTTSS